MPIHIFMVKGDQKKQMLFFVKYKHSSLINGDQIIINDKTCRFMSSVEDLWKVEDPLDQENFCAENIVKSEHIALSLEGV